jgi:hypothetical protein
MDDMSCCRDDPAHWGYHEDDYATHLDTVCKSRHSHCEGCMSSQIHRPICKDKDVLTVPLKPGPDFHSGNFPIESIRAVHLAGEPREQRFCSDCKPHLCDEDGGPDFVSIYDILDELHHSAE